MALEDDVARDFAHVSPHVAGLFLWGSHAEGRAHPRSDVDVCIVAGPGITVEEALRLAWSGAGASSRYDVHVFEELPLYLKGEILDRGRLLATRNELSLSEYLRPFRKIWDDQRRRATPTRDDVRRMLEARRRAAEG